MVNEGSFTHYFKACIKPTATPAALMMVELSDVDKEYLIRRSAENARRRQREHNPSNLAMPYGLPNLTTSASSGSSSSSRSQKKNQPSTSLPRRRKDKPRRFANRIQMSHPVPRGRSPRNLKQHASHPVSTDNTSSSFAVPGRTQRRIQRRVTPSPKNHSTDDNSILRGAQILRQQLLHVEDEIGLSHDSRALGGLNMSLDDEYDYQEALEVGLGINPQNFQDKRDDQCYYNDGEESFSGSDGEWSNPWVNSNAKPIPNMGQYEHIVVGNEDVALRTHGSWLDMEDEKSASSFPTKGDAADWADLSSVEENEDNDAPNKPKKDDQGYETLLDSSVEVHAPPSPTDPQGHRPRLPSDDNTPETFMGRDRTLKTKMVTYWVQRADDLDGDSTTQYSSSHMENPVTQQRDPIMSYLPNDLKRDALPIARRHTRDDDTGFMLGMEACLLTQSKWDELQVTVRDNLHITQHDELSSAQDSASTEYDQSQILEAARQDPNVRVMHVIPRDDVKEDCIPRDEVNEDCISPILNVTSGETRRYNELLKDPAFKHAQKAGILWQSLVSQHVRFPNAWFKAAHRTPYGGADGHRLWHYVGRHRVQDNPVLNFLVGNRGSSGRLLLHLVVRDLMTMVPVQDIAIGCFHPNARGVRWTTDFLPDLEDCRDVWMAIRRRTEECTVAESLLKPDDADIDGNPEVNESASPLGGKHAVSNRNMRPVFGEKAPIHTIFVLENELYELLSRHELKDTLPPALILLQHYLRP